MKEFKYKGSKFVAVTNRETNNVEILIGGGELAGLPVFNSNLSVSDTIIHFKLNMRKNEFEDDRKAPIMTGRVYKLKKQLIEKIPQYVSTTALICCIAFAIGIAQPSLLYVLYVAIGVVGGDLIFDLMRKSWES